MKKLLILYASYGSGHKSVGLYIKDYYENRGYEVMTIDLLSYAVPIIGPFTQKANEFLMTKVPSVWSLLYFAFDNRLTGKIYHDFSLKLFDNKELRETIIDFNPDLVIATHFYGSGLIAKYKHKNICNPKLITVITDYKAHDVWFKDVKNTDAIVVSHNDEKRRLMKYGFKNKQIWTSGIPILPIDENNLDKTKLMKKFAIKDNNPIILFFAGGGNGATNNLKYLNLLIRSGIKANVLFIAGKNKKAKSKAQELVKKYNADNVKVFGFVNVTDFYKVSDFVITKPGGAQITECLYYKKPMILIKSNGGQEIENRMFLLKKGYALGFITHFGFISQVKKLVKQEKVLNKMIKNIEKIKQEKSMEKLFVNSENLLKK